MKYYKISTQSRVWVNDLCIFQMIRIHIIQMKDIVISIVLKACVCSIHYYISLDINYMHLWSALIFSISMFFSKYLPWNHVLGCQNRCAFDLNVEVKAFYFLFDLQFKLCCEQTSIMPSLLIILAVKTSW